MVTLISRPRSARRGEAGYILIGVLILVALFFIALAVAAPVVAKDIERDKEVEAVQRGKQYTRAIKLYYKRYGSYPTTIKALENTNNIRYLRKRYTDPITGKDDWRLIHVGQAKVPVMGFFGKPLTGAPGSTAGSATTGLMGNGTGGLGSSNSSSAFGGASSPGFGTAIGGSTDSGGSSNGPSDGSGGVSAGGAGGTLPSQGGSATSGLGTNGTTGTGAGTGFNGSTTTGSGGSGFDGGGPIVGVGIPLTKKSLVVYHKQDAFNKWEFTYDPLQDQQTVSSSNIPGATGAGTPVGSGGSVGTGGISGNSGSTFGTPIGSGNTDGGNTDNGGGTTPPGAPADGSGSTPPPSGSTPQTQ